MSKVRAKARCSHCHHEGHNVRRCPNRTQIGLTSTENPTSLVQTAKELCIQNDTLLTFDWESVHEEITLDSEYPTSTAGPTDVHCDASAAEILQLFLDVNLVLMLVEELNCIIQENVGPAKFKKSKTYPITSDHFWAWLSIWIEMGLAKQPNIRAYWSESNRGNVIIKQRMSYTLWHTIWKALWHIPDDVFYHLESELQENFRKYWIPAGDVSIDETLVRHKGRRCGHLVYDKSKPAKHGIKYYMMVDSLAYNYWFKLHRKKSKEEKARDSNVTKELILQALSTLPVEHGPYHLYADNYYGSVELARELQDQNYYFTIGCRKNRPSWLWDHGLHAELKKNAHPHFNSFAAWLDQDLPILAISWDDRNSSQPLDKSIWNCSITNLKKQKGASRTNLRGNS